MKFPTFKKTTDFWFKESRPPVIPGVNAPLQTLVPDLGEKMGRRNVVRVNIKDGAVARQKEVDVTGPAEKRQKVTHDFFSARPPTPIPRGKDQTESSNAGGSKTAEKFGNSGGRAIVQEFAPSFMMSEGRVVSNDDSDKLEPRLAPTMLHGLALPNDMKMVSEDLQPIFVHASAYIVPVLSEPNLFPALLNFENVSELMFLLLRRLAKQSSARLTKSSLLRPNGIDAMRI